MPVNGNPSYGIYIHVPFCTKKCPYCHFYVVRNRAEEHAAFVRALSLDWQRLRKQTEKKQLLSVYFGGGTPSLLAPEYIKKILSWLPIEDSCEITLEANPETISKELLRAFKEAGINRLSIGVQSLDDALLTKLGRTHSSAKAIQSITEAASVGIENISIDLMYEIPHQTLASWETSLRALRTLPITHLSLYNLTFEEGTTFFRKQKTLAAFLPSSDESLAMLESAVQHLEAIGLRRYEISAFAKEGCQAVHNSGYWLGRPFLGLGPSAFSYWGGQRIRAATSLSKYQTQLLQGADPAEFCEELSYPASLKEQLAIRLRLLRGANVEELQQGWGAFTEEMWETLQQLQERDLVKKEGNALLLTEKGRLFYDTVAEEIV